MEEIKKSLKNKHLKRANESAQAIGSSTAILIAALRKDINLSHDNLSHLRKRMDSLLHEGINKAISDDLVANLTTLAENAPKLLSLGILVSSAIKEARNAQEYFESLKK